ncbi:transcriptional regulator, partial [Klebsiella sp. E-Nf3]
MQTLRSMMIFVQVAESGSFTKAAQQLDLSVPSVSVVVSKLEEELRVKLLNRSTRSLALTEAGKVFYRGCCRTLDEARQTHENMFAFNERPSGVLRIGCSPSMAHYVITHISAQLLERFPGLSVNLVTASPAPDLISHGLDLILRFGEIEDSGLYTRKVGSMPMVVCAAVSYLNKMGRPVHPDDIEKFDWLEYDIQPDN